MAASAGRAKGKKKQQPFDRLQGLAELDSEHANVVDFFQDYDESHQLALDSLTFRHHAPRTQHRQDRILETYYAWLKVMLKGKIDDPSADELDRFGFPSDEKGDNSFSELTRRLSTFLIQIVQMSVPRSLADEVVGYGMMMHYRMALMFWTNRKFKARNETPPSTSIVYNAITQAMRIVAHKMQMKLKRTPKSKSYLGLPELMQLIDLDTRGTANIALAEGHHLAWLLSRCCALRPGSIGLPVKTSRDDQVNRQFMALGDFDVTRRPGGQFDVKLTVRNLKIQTDRVAEETGYHTKTIEFYIKSPENQHNLALSVPHRFLVLALRRGALEHYTTVDELLNDNRRHIKIKDEFLEKPLVVQGTPRGLGVNLDKPCLAENLTEYLQVRGRRMGYEQPVTMYSIRRRAGTDFAKVVGMDGARKLMGHEPDSRMLEKCYADLMSTADVTSLALGESGHARASEMEMDSHKLALSRLDPRKVAEFYAAPLNALFRQSLVSDEEYLKCTTTKDRKNRERVLRRCALSEFMAEAHREQKAAMTIQQYEYRADELIRRATDFNKTLLTRIKDAASTPESIQASQESANMSQDDDDLYEDAFEEFAEEDVHEPDADDQIVENQTEFHAVEEDMFSATMTDYGSLLDAVSYETSVEALMKLLMENGMSSYNKPEPRQCPLCLDDDTMREEDGKLKVWKPKHLKIHLQSNNHSKFRQLLREARNKKKADNAEALECKFCAEIAPHEYLDRIPSFPTPSELSKHWKRSNETKIESAKSWSTRELARTHEELKILAGFGEEDFMGPYKKSKQKVDKDRWRRKIRVSDLAIRNSQLFSASKTLLGPMPLPGNPSIMRGSFTELGSKHLETGTIVAGPMPTVKTATGLSEQEMEKVTAAGFTKTMRPRVESLTQPATIPLELAGKIDAVPLPSLEGNLFGQGHRVSDMLRDYGE